VTAKDEMLAAARAFAQVAAQCPVADAQTRTRAAMIADNAIGASPKAEKDVDLAGLREMCADLLNTFGGAHHPR
jgi:hypothetical protein